MTDKLVDAILKRGSEYPTDSELFSLITDGHGIDIDLKMLTDEERREKFITMFGKTIAAKILAAIELERRVYAPVGAKISSPSDAVPYIQHIGFEKNENFVVIELDGARRIKCIWTAAVGGLDAAVVKVRDIFSHALKTNVSAIVLCHNHPSGTLYPSDDDIRITKRLVEAGMIIGISVLDHIIVTNCEYYSFLEHDVMPSACNDALVAAEKDQADKTAGSC